VSTPDLAAASAPFPVSLERRLGPIDAAAIVVSNVIGGGIFFVPILVAKEVPSGWALLGVWIFGGALAFAGAMAYAELATLRPHAGGEYVYLREAYGRVAAFLTGWTSFVAGFSGAIAAAAVGLAGFLGSAVPVLADRTPWFSLPLGVLSLTRHLMNKIENPRGVEPNDLLESDGVARCRLTHERTFAGRESASVLEFAW